MALVHSNGFDMPNSFLQPFLDVGGDLSEALLYLDAGAGEAVHLNLGLKALSGLRVPHVFALEEPEALHTEVYRFLTGSLPKKLVILTTQLLTVTHNLVLKTIQAHPTVQSCTIYCSVSEEAHASLHDTSLGEDAYLEYENALREDVAEMASQGGTGMTLTSLSVNYFPLQACALTSSSFVLPALSSAASMSLYGNAAESTRLQQGQPAQHADSRRGGQKLLAHALVGLGAALDCRLEIFSLGTGADALGAECCNILPPEAPGGRVPKKSAALVLVDRSLDAATPLQHSDHVVDRIFGSLARRAGQPDKFQGYRPLPSDVAIPMERDAQGDANSLAAESNIGHLSPAGSLFPTATPSMGTSDSSHRWLETLTGRPGKDAILYVRKWLKEGIRKEGLQSPKARFKPGTVTAAELQSLVDVLTSSPVAAIKQRSLIQLSSAVICAMEGPCSDLWEALAKQEKQLNLLSAEGCESIVLELQDLLRLSTANGILQLRDAVLLMFHGYILAADASQASLHSHSEQRSAFSQEQHKGLKGALVAAIRQAHVSREDIWLGSLKERLSDPNRVQLDSAASESDYDNEALRLEIEDKAEELLTKIKASSTGRQQLPRLQRALVTGREGQGATPLLAWLVAALAAGQPIAEMQHHSASLRNLLNSGLGRFGIKQKELVPADHDRMIVFVVGGISSVDIRAAIASAEATEQAQKFSVVYGGTALLSPQQYMKQLLL